MPAEVAETQPVSPHDHQWNICTKDAEIQGIKKIFLQNIMKKAAQIDNFPGFKTLLWELTNTPKGNSQQLQRDGI